MTAIPHPCTFLIVGYGNPLRGDDGVGPQVARTVADWQIPWVKTLAVPQLMPELAVEMETVDYAIFVDAWGKSGASPPPALLCLEPIVTPPCHSPPALDHAWSPTALVILTQRLYGRYPQAWLLPIPTERCELGETLSETAQQGVNRALRTIEQCLTTYRRPIFTPVEPCMKSA